MQDIFYSDEIIEIKDDRKKTIHTINPKEINNGLKLSNNDIESFGFEL